MLTDQEQAVLATTTLTGSYQVTSWVPAGNSGQVAFDIDYTKGGETTVDFVVEFGRPNGSAYQELCQTVSPPDITMKPAVRHLTAADFASGTSRVRCVIGTGDAKVRLKFKYTGGSSPGSVAVTAQESADK